MKRILALLVAVALVAALAIVGYFRIQSLREHSSGDPVGDASLVTISVETSYPGANALVVADAVAAPIEQQVNGVEGLLSLYSRSTNDGNYTLTVTFGPDVDPNMAQVLVQNRVSLAVPQLPEVIQQTGITVRKKSPALLGFVLLSAPDGRFDTRYLSNYATLQLKDELARVAGVADVLSLGQREQALRVWLDPDKLASRGVTVLDVTKVLAEQHAQVAAGAIGQQPVPAGQVIPLIVKPLRDLPDPDNLAKLTLKADGEGRLVRLGDVARLEMAAGQSEGEANLNGKPVVALGLALLPRVHPREVLAAVQEKLTSLRQHLPDGIDLALAFDFTANLEAPDRAETPGYFRLDLSLPDNSSRERTRTVAARCVEILRSGKGVREILTVTGPPYAAGTNEAFLLVSLAPSAADNREKLREELRQKLAQEIPDARASLWDVTRSGRFPLGGAAIEMALEDRGDQGLLALRDLGDTLVQRLSARPELKDVQLSAGARTVPQLHIDIDRVKAEAMGVALNDVFTTLQVFLGEAPIGAAHQFGRTWQVRLQVDRAFRDNREDLLKLMVRNAQGQMVPLRVLATVAQTDGPAIVERFNLYRMVGLTANPTPGVSLAQAHQVIERTFADERPGFALESMRPALPRKLAPWR
jgi:multidrug efflux pump subunit AcrB